jgi:hypothetical protein
MNVALTWNQLCSTQEWENYYYSGLSFFVAYYYATPTNGNGVDAPRLAKEFNLYVVTLSWSIKTRRMFANTYQKLQPIH